MTKRTNIIPRRDTDFAIFQQTVMQVCTLNQLAWNIDPGSLARLLPLQQVFNETWAIARDRGSRTKADTAAKTIARNKYEAALRSFIQSCIQYNVYVPDASKEGMSIKPHAKTRSEIPVPDSVPVLMIIKGNGPVLRLYFSQAPVNQAKARTAKPDGVKFCDVVYKTGGEAPLSPEECKQSAMMTRNNLPLAFAPELQGTRVYFFARWRNKNNVPGPWTTLPLVAYIPA